MASLVHDKLELAPSRRTARRSRFLWRRKASAPPEPTRAAFSWSGATVAEIRRQGRVVADTAQHAAERSGKVVVDGARGVRQVVAAAVPVAAVETAGRAAMWAGLVAVLLILLKAGSKLLRDRIGGPRVCRSLPHAKL